MAKLRKSDIEQAAIRESAKRVFSDHVITELSRNGIYRTWRCQTPGRWDYAFTVTTTPYHLMITGDLGVMVIARVYDMVPFLRKCSADPHYISEKVEAIKGGKARGGRLGDGAFEPKFLWLYEALRWFISNVGDEPEIIDEK